jgi:hypothetical protein
MNDAEWTKLSTDGKLNELRQAILTLERHINSKTNARFDANEQGISEAFQKIEELAKLVHAHISKAK